MEIAFVEQGWEDYLYWQKHDKKMLRKINEIIKDIARTPTEGIGKPEALIHNLQDYWSRRISLEHRLVYRIHNNQIRILQCRYHY